MRLFATVALAAIPSACAVSGNTFRFWKAPKSVKKISYTTGHAIQAQPVSSPDIERLSSQDVEETRAKLSQIHSILDEVNVSNTRTNAGINEALDRMIRLDQKVDEWKNEIEAVSTKLDKLVIDLGAVTAKISVEGGASPQAPIAPPFPTLSDGLVPPPPPPPPMMGAPPLASAPANKNRTGTHPRSRESLPGKPSSFVDELKEFAGSSSDSDDEQIGSKLLASIAKNKSSKRTPITGASQEPPSDARVAPTPLAMSEYENSDADKEWQYDEISEVTPSYGTQ